MEITCLLQSEALKKQGLLWAIFEVCYHRGHELSSHAVEWSCRAKEDEFQVGILFYNSLKLSCFSVYYVFIALLKYQPSKSIN